jgi:dsDNA-binding SOS-regulon protein
MNSRNLAIAILSGVAIGFAGWYFLSYRPKQAAKSGDGKSTGNKATFDQYDKFVDTATKGGSDILQGASASKLTEMRNKFVANLSKNDADKMIAILSKKEREWTASEKIDFVALFAKWTGKNLK